jgi:glutamate-1-semialdehyde 2,1-aminomutase
MTLVLYALGAVGVGASLKKASTRLQLSRAKHPSLRGHARMSRFVARLVPFYEYGEQRFFRCDGAPDDVVQLRRAGFQRLADTFATRFAKTRQLTRDVEDGLSDLQFTGAYRVPFQFSRHVKKNLGAGSFVAASSGVTLTDLDGNIAHDLAGSYGVNVFGYDFYKACLDRGFERARALGPVLGSYHPVVADNVRRL